MNKLTALQRYNRKLIAGFLLCAAVAPAADAAYLLAKAELAQWLIGLAWEKNTTALSTARHRPWPWADTHPVARLQIANLDIDSWVLNGASGTTLAFGPGLSHGSSAIGNNGLTMISAHRDTHFKNLQNIAIGEQIKLQDSNRRWYTYEVTHIGIADSRTDSLPVASDHPRLALVTCYPFNALTTGGPLRYVVEAELLR